MPEARRLLAAAQAAADAGEAERAVRLCAEAIAAAPDDAVLRLQAALLHARLARPFSALALALPALVDGAEARLADLGAMVADRLMALGDVAGAAAIARRAASGQARPAIRALLLAAGLPAFRQTLQDEPDLPLLEAMVAAACTTPALIATADGTELARLAEEAGREDLLRALGAAAGPAGRERLLQHGLAAVQSLSGLAHAATHRPARAALAFAAAHAAAAGDPSARFNAGYAALAAGDSARAMALLAALPAAGEPMMAGAAWPRFGELPWPFAAPPEAVHAALDTLLPPGARWPRIRLVTPCLNPGPWLEETILSVARQHYPAIEHVVVDGGSTDGTSALLARYRDTLHAVIAGPDGGPAEAIAKGLAGTEADLVGWLNADDLLAPGALHRLGAAWAAQPEADLVHGFAIVHRARRVTGVQRALADGPQGFTPEGLADIFGQWGEGAFFLQPEVLVARRFFAALGGLDTRLASVFDYEFWLRAAAARARIAQVAWPTAFYRIHPAQRSGRRAALAAEQVAVRDRHIQPAPAPERTATIAARLRGALAPHDRPARWLLIDPGCAETISPAALAEARTALGAHRIALDVARAVSEGPLEADLLLRIAGAHDGAAWIEALRAHGFAGPVIAWCAEDDRDAPSHAAMARALDLVVPSRAARRGMLLQTHALVTEAMPAPTGLVAEAEATVAFAAGASPGAAVAGPWEPGAARLAAALRGEGPMEAPDRHALALALLAGRSPIMPPGLAEMLGNDELPAKRAARRALGRAMLLAPSLLRLLARLKALAGAG